MEMTPPITPPITIVGCGPGAADYLTVAAREAVAAADVLCGSRRLLEMFPCAGRERIQLAFDDKALDELDAIVRQGRPVTVLVSGDPGVFSAAKGIVARFGRDRCRVIPGISSLQVAFARLGLDWAGARIVSAHGRIPAETHDVLAGCDKIAVFAGTPEALAWTAALAERLAATHSVWLCERLTMEGERVRPLAAAKIAACGAASLSLLLLIRKELLS